MNSAPGPGTIERRRGTALVLVLAYVVLLAGIVTAYLASTTSDRQLAQGSFTQIKADQLARSALSIVIGDLKQEIADGSTSTIVNGITIHTPTVAANILPQRTGQPDGIPNLVRCSLRSDPVTPPGIPSRASALSSAPLPSSSPVTTEKGEISASRWNKHYLIPRPNGAAPTDPSPISTFVAPDWVFVSSATGPIVLSEPAPSVIGRYAYAVYDEGGLLDANVAGFPPVAELSIQFGGKGLLPFADLTMAGLSNSAVSDLVGWRNYASTRPNGSFGNFLFDATSASRFLDLVRSNSDGFMTTSSYLWNGRTDQMFTSRQMLLAYRASTGFSPGALQHLGIFSRDLNLTTYPSASIRRVTANFLRSDGSIAREGEPLFRRFLLSKLSWIGQNGPNPISRAPDIRRDFGLIWNLDHWDYYGSAGSSLAGAISDIDGTREPEFFQLLNFARTSAGIIPTIDAILSLGASIIDQYDDGADDTPTVIEYAGPPGPSPAPPNPRVYGREISAPSPVPDPAPIILNRPFTNVGDLGYAYKTSSATLDFHSAGTMDTVLLDLFSVSPVSLHAGVINLNTRNSVVLAAILAGTIKNNQSAVIVSATNARNAALDIAAATDPAAGIPALGRHEIGRITAAVRSSATGQDEEGRELISRSLTEMGQTRTWNLMIDMIAQTGRFSPTATSLHQFLVEGERRYWLHVAIDRFSGQVIDQQLETVFE